MIVSVVVLFDGVEQDDRPVAGLDGECVHGCDLCQGVDDQDAVVLQQSDQMSRWPGTQFPAAADLVGCVFGLPDSDFLRRYRVARDVTAGKFDVFL
jgi:hypothetical protein